VKFTLLFAVKAGQPETFPSHLKKRERKREMSESEVPGKEANVLKGHEGAVLVPRFNSDKNYFLSCGKDTPLESPPWHPHQDLQIPCP